jgi:hypothetical protein
MKKKDRRTGCQVYFTAEVHKKITEAAKKAGARFRTTWMENIIEAALKESQ